jgi:glycosyl transferase family 25
MTQLMANHQYNFPLQPVYYMEDRQHFFQQLNSFFDHIYVITLERATDRHEHIRKELAGLNYGLFFGKDKQQFSIEALKASRAYDEEAAKKHHRYSKPMQSGQIGCAWSHAEVYKDILSKGHQKALILEDDVVINQKTIHFFQQTMKELPSDWELLYLGYAEREIAPPGLIFKKLFYHTLRLFGAVKFSHTTINHLYPKKLSTHIAEAGYHDCTHAYAITKSAAEKLLRLQQPISFVADNLLAHAITNQLVKGYITRPQFILQQYQVGTSSASYLND